MSPTHLIFSKVLFRHLVILGMVALVGKYGGEVWCEVWWGSMVGKHGEEVYGKKNNEI